MDNIIKVPQYKFEEMNRKDSCMELSEGKSPKGTVFFQNREFLIDAAYGTGTGKGWAKFSGNEVTDIENYKGTLTPLPRGKHLAECDFGRRERGGAGEIIKFGSRTLVTLERYYFIMEESGTQINLF